MWCKFYNNRLWQIRQLHALNGWRYDTAGSDVFIGSLIREHATDILGGEEAVGLINDEADA